MLFDIQLPAFSVPSSVSGSRQKSLWIGFEQWRSHYDHACQCFRNGGLFEAIEHASEKANLDNASFQLVRYDPLESSSTFIKYEVAVEETIEKITQPLKDEQEFLLSLGQEHMWMLSDIWKVK